MQGIYKIRNKANGRYYVGRSQDIEERWIQHKKDLDTGKHQNQHLQAAWDEHGEASFVFEVVEEIRNIANLIRQEQVWLDKAFLNDDPYNILEQADGSDLSAKLKAGVCSPPRRRVGRPRKPKHLDDKSKKAEQGQRPDDKSKTASQDKQKGYWDRIREARIARERNTVHI